MKNALLALLFSITLAMPAFGQASCADREVVVKMLADDYGESIQSIGIGQNGSVIEVYANEETGTWTVLLTRPNGITCLMASGHAYEYVSEKVKTGTAL